MIDPHLANQILGRDPEFQQLRGVFNALGIWRFIVYVIGGIGALVAGINNEIGVLLLVCLVGFVIVMILNYNRMTTRARQQRRAIELGVITEDDVH